MRHTEKAGYGFIYTLPKRYFYFGKESFSSLIYVEDVPRDTLKLDLTISILIEKVKVKVKVNSFTR